MKVSPKQYAKLLFEVFESTDSNEKKQNDILMIANYMLKKRDQKKLRKIEFEFEKMLVAQGKKLPVLVESAHELDDEQIEKIRKALATERKVPIDVVEIEKKLNKKLIGSLRIVMGNEIIDDSLFSRISTLKRALK